LIFRLKQVEERRVDSSGHHHHSVRCARSREQAERLGCVAYLGKPCEAETILTLLRSLVDDDSSIH
jgi:hypothetical protein